MSVLDVFIHGLFLWNIKKDETIAKKKKKKDESISKYFRWSNCKTSKIRADKGSEFYNRFMKSWLKLEINSCFSKNDTCKYMTSALKFIHTSKMFT